MNALQAEGRNASDRVAPSNSYVRYVIIMLAVVNVFNYMDRYALSVLAPSIQKDLHITDSQLGILTGVAFALFYAICGVPIGRWADRSNRRNIVAASLALWSCMTALSGVAHNFWQLLIARMGVGAGEAGGFAPAQSILCDYVPREKRGGVFALHNLGFIVGMSLGVAVAGLLVDVIGWRWTFIAMGLPGVVLAIVLFLTVREPTRGIYDAPAQRTEALSTLAALRTLARSRTYVPILIAVAAAGIINLGFNLWWPSFFVRSHDFDFTSVGTSYGIATGFGAAAGLLLGGLISNKGAEHGAGLPLLAAAIANALAAAVIVCALLVPSPIVSLVMIGVMQFCLQASTPCIMASMFSVVPASIRTTGGTLAYLSSTALGGLGPLIIGAMSEAFTPRFGSDGLRHAMLVTTGLFPIVVGGLYFASRRIGTELSSARPAQAPVASCGEGAR